ncbi:MAG: DUF167 family protein [Gammaproteobacteria bacterium]|nr:DUF167 family protein [Gammaproteobacteria bacterium]
MTENTFYKWQKDTLILPVYVQPKASKNEIVGIHNHQLKIRITAPPVDGKANIHLRKFLAQIFNTPLSCVTLIRGDSSREKLFHIKQPQSLPTQINHP